VIGSPGFDRDEQWLRWRSGRAFDRGYDPPGLPAKRRRRRRSRAELLVIDGFGHDLPSGVWPQLADAIAATVRRAEG